MGNNRKMVYSYEMVIKNNRKTAVKIGLEDQLPISQNSEIIVDAVELSKGLVNFTQKNIFNKSLALEMRIFRVFC